MGDALAEGLHLGVDTHLGGRQSGDAHLHLDELHARGLLGLRGYLFHFADGGLGEVVDAKVGNQTVDD